MWVNSSDSNKVFLLQKKVIRIVAGIHKRVSCRELFKKFLILTIASEYLHTRTYSIYRSKLGKYFTQIQCGEYKSKYDPHRLLFDLTDHYKGVYCAGITL
jgi:hypothetical protein